MVDVAKEAYVYGFPIVDLYRIEAAYFFFPRSPAFKAPINTVYNTPNVSTPADATIQSPNADTPYSFVMFDLRAEPYVLTLPAIEKNRYYSVQLVDQYTFNFAYLGTRTTGNAGGRFLIAGPGWKGAVPRGIDKVVRGETDFIMAGIRTQLFGASDLARVHQIQAGYKIASLSAFSGARAPPAAPAVHWMLPLSAAAPTSSEFNVKAWIVSKLMPPERTSPKFFDVLSFVLQFCPVDPSEVALRKGFESIGIQPGNFRPPSGVTQEDLVAGMAAGQQEIDVARAATKSSRDLFGTREAMHNNYLNRSLGAQLGILGNTAAEAVYLNYSNDANGKPLSGAHKYTVHFAPGGLPPVNAFWSITMYNLPQQLLVANPINRYLINSPMLPQLKRDLDGGLTIFVQQSSPGPGREPNWLPAPKGGFFAVLRAYNPKEAILSGSWKLPPMQPVK
ncbi:MAG TPA: DUF1254 domain-containing protein [Candidatus Binatia bacterium]|nr:DUF1254 domain-containing protein [Candidatus Binatia bacterium]